MPTKTIKSEIYDSIWNDIITGVYETDFVFNEKALVEKYNVSKSPVRDALVELCKEGVLRSIPRYGYEIVKVPEKQLREIVDLRIIIECDNLRQICENPMPEQLALLKEYNRKSEIITYTKDQDARVHWQNNMSFHRLLYSLSNNEFGMSLLERCLRVETVAYSQFYRFTLSNNRQMTIDYHKKIVELMELGQYKEAVEALRTDIEFIKTFH